MAKRGIDEHPKTIEFAERLGIPVCYAVGPLELFWHWVAKYHPRGDIGGTKPSAIAHAIRFPKTGQELVDALLAAGFLDRKGETMIVHDWSEHADNAVHAALKKRGETFADGQEPFTRNRARQAKKEAELAEGEANRPHPVHEPEPDGSRTVHEPDTNGSRSPARVWPDTRYQIPEPEEEGAAGFNSLVGVWAPLGDWLDDERVRSRLVVIERNRAAASPPLRPVIAEDSAKVATVVKTNRITIDEFVGVLEVAVERRWRSLNCEAVVRICRGLREGSLEPAIPSAFPSVAATTEDEIARMEGVVNR